MKTTFAYAPADARAIRSGDYIQAPSEADAQSAVAELVNGGFVRMTTELTSERHTHFDRFDFGFGYSDTEHAAVMRSETVLDSEHPQDNARKLSAYHRRLEDARTGRTVTRFVTVRGQTVPLTITGGLGQDGNQYRAEYEPTGEVSALRDTPLAASNELELAMADGPQRRPTARGGLMEADERTAKLRKAIGIGIADWLDSTRAAEVYARAPRVPRRRRPDTRMHLVGVVGGASVVGSLANAGLLGYLVLTALVAFGVWGWCRKAGARAACRRD